MKDQSLVCLNLQDSASNDTLRKWRAAPARRPDGRNSLLDGGEGLSTPCPRCLSLRRTCDCIGKHEAIWTLFFFCQFYMHILLARLPYSLLVNSRLVWDINQSSSGLSSRRGPKGAALCPERVVCIRVGITYNPSSPISFPLCLQ